MKKQHKRILAAALAAVLIWNTCEWQLPVLAADAAYQVEAVETLSEEILYQEVPYGTKYRDLELPNKLKMLVETKDTSEEDQEEDIANIATPSQLQRRSRKASSSDAEDRPLTASPSDADDPYSGENWKNVRVRWVLCENFSENETYDGNTPGIYVFEAELKNDRYELVDDILPRIEVTVLPQEQSGKITGFLPLDETIMIQNLPLGSDENDIHLPETLKVQTQNRNKADEKDEAPYQITGVTWKLDKEKSDLPQFYGGISEKDYFEAFEENGEPIETSTKTRTGYAEINREYNGRAYVYTPVLPEDLGGFELAEETELPQVYVLVGDAELMTMAQKDTYDLGGKPLKINADNWKQYDNKTITGTYKPEERADDYININGGITITGDITVNLTIEDVSIGYKHAGWDLAGICLEGKAKLNLTLKGENTLSGADMGAGIEVGESATLVITSDSTGSLEATGGGYGAAGIGGKGSFFSAEGGGGKDEVYKTGTIIIQGGTIRAHGGRYQMFSEFMGGAGIGTGPSGCGGKIVIEGGDIEAEGGMYDAAGIGGGFDGMVDLIRIGGSDGKDLTVKASSYIADKGGAAIGTGVVATNGSKLSCGKIEILNGDITAEGNIGYAEKRIYTTGDYSGGSISISDEVNLKLTGGTIKPRGDSAFGKKTFQISINDKELLDGKYTAKVKLYKESDTEQTTPVFEIDTSMTVSAFQGSIPDITQWMGYVGNLQVEVELTDPKNNVITRAGTAVLHKGKDETVPVKLGKKTYEKTLDLTVYDGRLKAGKEYTLSVQVGENSDSSVQPDRVSYTAKKAADYQIKAGKSSWYSSLTGEQPVLVTIKEEESGNAYTVSGSLVLNDRKEPELILSVGEPLYPVYFQFYSPQVQGTDKMKLKARRKDAAAGTQTELNQEQGQFAFNGKLEQDTSDEDYAVATAYFPAGEYRFEIETGISGLGDSNGNFILDQQVVKADNSGTDLYVWKEAQALISVDYEKEVLNNTSQRVVEFAVSKDASSWTAIPVNGNVALAAILDAQPDDATEISLYVRKQTVGSGAAGEVIEITIPSRPQKPDQIPPDKIKKGSDHLLIQEDNGKQYEYGIADEGSGNREIRWQQDTRFDNLQPAHTYSLTLRIRATKDRFASKPAGSTNVTTQDVLSIVGNGDKMFTANAIYGSPLSLIMVQLTKGYQVVNSHGQEVVGTWSWSADQNKIPSSKIYPEVNGTESYQVEFTPEQDPAGLYAYSLKKNIQPEISPKMLTAVLSSPIEKTYDGSLEAAVAAEVNTEIEGQTLMISGLKGRFADANVGTGKKVMIDPSKVKITAGQSQTDPDNYQITFPSETTGMILPTQGNVTIDPNKWSGQKTYGDTDFSLTGVAAVGDGQLVYTSSDESVLTIDTKGMATIKGAGLADISVSMTDGSNYIGTSVPATETVRVEKGTIRFSLTAEGKKGQMQDSSGIYDNSYDITASAKGAYNDKLGGNVAFYDNGQLLGKVQLKDGKAMIHWTVPEELLHSAMSVHRITAEYELQDTESKNYLKPDPAVFHLEIGKTEESNDENEIQTDTVKKDPVKGKISSDLGIITGADNSMADDGYSHWMRDERGWWLRFLDSSYPKAEKSSTSAMAYVWEFVNGNWWAFDENGYAKTGWLMDGTLGGWFYVDPKRGMQTGWVLDNGIWYYFHTVSDGRKGIMYTSRRTPDGYYVGEDGACNGRGKLEN